MSDKSIGVAELIEKLKQELIHETSKSPELFAISSVALEITFTVERDAQGGIDLQVVKLGADKKTSDVQTVKVNLEPLVTPEMARAKLTPKQVEEIERYTTRTFRPGGS